MSEALKPCPFCGADAEDGSQGMVQCRSCGAAAFGPKWNRRTGGIAQAPANLPDRERMAEILYTAAHKGLRNCWKWSDGELDHEHPTSRGYWYKIADGTLSALSSTTRGSGK